jgi:carbonic anhydrase
MRKNTDPRSVRFALLLAAATLLSACGSPSQEPQQPAAPEQATAAAEAPHWDYAEHGPATWGGLGPQYATCGEGRSQSPIDITSAAASELPALAADYGPATLSIVHHEHKADEVNTGHSIQVNYPGADTLTVDDQQFELLQYHFHSPSEHTVDGRHFPMEMHLVHKSAEGKLTVVGVLIQEGAENPAFAPVWENLPAHTGDERHLEHVTVDVDQLLPTVRTTYRYDGSLTTPPCSEGVKWFVMTTPIELSAGQIEKFRTILHGNNRPVQPLNGRAVVTDAVGDQT